MTLQNHGTSLNDLGPRPGAFHDQLVSADGECDVVHKIVQPTMWSFLPRLVQQLLQRVPGAILTVLLNSRVGVLVYAYVCTYNA